jgi:hypothetical protein
MVNAPLPALILFMVSAFTCSVLHGQTRPFNSAHFNLQELAPGVWAAVNNDSGGLLFNVRHAWIGDGDPDAWTGHLQGWSLLPESTRFVPGHGQPGDMRIVQGMIEYLTTLKGLVAAYPKGTPDSTITSIPVPDRFKDWKLRRFHPMNLAFLWERRKAGDSRQ